MRKVEMSEEAALAMWHALLDVRDGQTTASTETVEALRAFAQKEN
jgi:hypothetical protein